MDLAYEDGILKVKAEVTAVPPLDEVPLMDWVGDVKAWLAACNLDRMDFGPDPGGTGDWIYEFKTTAPVRKWKMTITWGIDLVTTRVKFDSTDLWLEGELGPQRTVRTKLAAFYFSLGLTSCSVKFL